MDSGNNEREREREKYFDGVDSDVSIIYKKFLFIDIFTALFDDAPYVCKESTTVQKVYQLLAKLSP